MVKYFAYGFGLFCGAHIGQNFFAKIQRAVPFSQLSEVTMICASKPSARSFDPVVIRCDTDCVYARHLHRCFPAALDQ